MFLLKWIERQKELSFRCTTTSSELRDYKQGAVYMHRELKCKLCKLYIVIQTLHRPP